MKVYITYRIPEAGLKKLEGKCDVSLNEEDELLSKGELSDRVTDADALICLLGDRIDRDIINAGRKLRVISNFAVGYNNIDVDYATRQGIMVTNTPGVLTDTTADLTWALIMAVARRTVEGDSFMRSGKFSGWKPELMLGSDIHGSTLGIIGFGRIGQAVARRASGFNMQVLYCSSKPVSREAALASRATYVELDTLLSRSDFVTLHVPLTDSTYHLIDENKLFLMKPTACLINTSRGPVVDERALVKSLHERKIAGAALDVYENEPALSPGLTELSNVVLTPHVGSATHQTRNRMSEMVAENVVAVLSGENPPNLVNKELLRQKPAQA
ncbi:MAG: D-glycerate dehydrogenase [Dehalococcoidia bacterium]|nr:D-glycerate dehydrogenase [Dehalococcoidia bacterium]